MVSSNLDMGDVFSVWCTTWNS